MPNPKSWTEKPTKPLRDRIAEYNKFAQTGKIDEKFLESYVAICSVAFSNAEYVHDYAFAVSRQAKQMIGDYIYKKTGRTVWQLVKWCYAHKEWVSVLDLYYAVLLFEAQHKDFDSYMRFLERNRDPKDRFYAPKRTQLWKFGVVQALQGMLDDKYDILSISMPPGTGKAQPLYSKVLTPSGFKAMGDIRIGDIVIAGNGKKSKVIGVFPQGKRAIYELTFDDGSKCRCSDNHLWTVQTRDDRNKRRFGEKGRYRTVPLSDMLNNLTVEHGRKNYSIDYVPAIDYKKKNLKLHPYVMGVLIGDGGIKSGTPDVSTEDQELLDNINRFLPEGYYMKHHDRCTYSVHGHDGNNCKAGSAVTKALKYYGIYGRGSENKFVPKDYLYANYEQRLWLLRGLLDTDGWVEPSGVGYCTVSEQLAKDVQELVHSLGGYASIRVKKSGYRKNGIYKRCNDAYSLFIQFSSQMDNVFGLKRKADKFQPKRSTIKRFLSKVEYVGEEECQCIYIDDPCHLYITDNYIITHNTTLEKFFNAGVMGWFPKDYCLFYSHSADITRMYYDGVLDIVTNSDEYTWGEIFAGENVTSTNAKAEQINIGKYKPFPSLQTTSVGSKNAGKVRASKFLLVDDMIASIEEALNKNTLDKLWQAYSVDARQRKVEDSDGKPCKEIHIATRWSVNDVIGRLQRMYEGNPRVKFIAIPDLDPVTGESNFDYEIGGFTKEFFEDQALLMDDISYRCLYKQEPIEREGLLYHEDELRRFINEPSGEPDAILGVCDTKDKGTDFMVLPVMYQYGQDFYMMDCICDDSADYGRQKERLTEIITRFNMQQCEFESNAGGGRLADEVALLLKAKGARCNITTKPTETNKETRIIVNSDWVKKHVLFRSKENYTPKSDYGVFMNWLLSYSVAGKNAHDDVPDCIANFALYVTNMNNRPTTMVMHSPWS